MPKRASEVQNDDLALKDGHRPDADEEGGENLDFEDDYEDEFESEDEVMEAGVDGRPDTEREVNPDAMDVDSNNQTFIPGRSILQPGQMLAPDPSTYEMLHVMSTTWPCLSFDIVRDNLGEDRKSYPRTVYAVAGTQAESARSKDNELYVLKLSGLSKMDRGNQTDSESDEDSDDEDVSSDPVLESKSIPLSSTTNRIRSFQLPNADPSAIPTTLTATSLESGEIVIHDVTPQLHSLSTPGFILPSNASKPLSTLRMHKAEGYALDWASSTLWPLGRLLSGDNNGHIYMTQRTEGGGFTTDQRSFTQHTGSIEELQWSPTEKTVFASASSDGTVKVWDTRSKSRKAAVDVHISSSDVNVMSWSHQTAHLLATGCDDGQWAVWDLRQWRPQSGPNKDTPQAQSSGQIRPTPVASFNFHKKPITSIEWHPTDDSVVGVASADGTVTLWDLSVELDDEEYGKEAGIGGAERLIIDAAVGLQQLGHKVTIFTSHCDPQHCFEEARDGTLDVRVRGNTIFPPTIFNRLHILLAILRQIHLILAIGFFSDELFGLRPDVFIVDQLAACVPLLRWLYPKRQRTLFYCHFPDQLLANRKDGGVIGIVKSLYRIPFDWFEGWSIGASDKIVVNSNFTKSVANKIFPSLSGQFDVVYPCVRDSDEQSSPKDAQQGTLWGGKFQVLLSINRFERKKDVGLAIKAYKGLSDQEMRGSRLVLAGGYDNRVSENVEYHRELEHLAGQLGLVAATAKTVPSALGIPDSVQVLFLLSVPGSFKNTLLNNASLLLYTPTNEHFGIVPVEAMQHGVPVLAANTGGPLETIVDGETGWLRSVDNVDEWTQVIYEVLQNKPATKSVRQAGPKRVKKNFTRTIMAKKFDSEIASMIQSKRSKFTEARDLFMGLALVAVLIAALITAIMNHRFGPNSKSRMSEFTQARRKYPSENGRAQQFPLYRAA
ncbi:hypothetical protein DV736_g3898, partial [Chaetothyriales sp. CBS 134916]